MKTRTSSAAAPRRARLQFAAALAAGALALAGSALAAGESMTYTLDADFDLGVLSGVNHTAVANQLQLSTVGTTAPILWIANAGEDTVSKFDTVNNKELARYRTWFGPSGQPGYVYHIGSAYSGAAPSRTAVDLDGNAFVLNRHFDGRPARLFKILAEGGIDRNGNGVIDTSADTNNDGTISAGEMKNLADANGNGAIDPSELQDERIAWSVTVGPANGLGRSLCIGTDGNLWVGLYNFQQYYKVSAVDGSILAGPVPVSWTPYGCAIDRSGNLWSASLGGTLGKITNTASNTGPYGVSAFYGNFNYGIALGNDKVYLGSANQQFNPVTNSYAAIPNMYVSTSGIVTDGSGNIIGGNTTVRKLSSAGALLWQAPLQSGGSYSIGIQVDSENNVWQVGFYNGRLAKYRGSDGAALGTFAVGDMPYTYSDASGLSARTVTNNTGSWTVVRDAAAVGTKWGKVSWNAAVPLGASIGVRVRAADVQANLALQPYTAVSNGVDFTGITGRFVQVETRLNANLADESPLLYDLTVASIKSNDPPTVDISSPTDGQLFSATAGAVTLTAALTDPNPGDTHSCTIDWGNGVASTTGTVNEAAGAGTCTGSQTLGAGIYNVTVTVGDGEFSVTDTVMIVVYDATAGFVTGGGWINSPAGAFTLNPAMIGRANFGFVSKYQPGANAPSGQTEFQFQVADLNFHSTSYDWLVVAGAKAQYKGTGTINREGDYGFMLTATDGQLHGNSGQPDKFRIKIWNKATGAIVYDNQLGDADDAAVKLAIAGGNIVVHTKK